jgi:hypothetical protein
MKIQRSNIKHWTDLRLFRCYRHSNRIFVSKAAEIQVNMENVNGEGVKLGLLSCHWNGIQSESRPEYSRDYNCQRSTGLLLAISCGLEVVCMWCGLTCQILSSLMTRMELSLETLLCWWFNHLTWLVVRELSLAFIYHCRFRLSQNVFARTGTEDGAKDRRNKTWQVGWSRVLSDCFCVYFAVE